MPIVTFTNARICRHGTLHPTSSVYFDTASGLFVRPADTTDVEIVDLQNRILAPAFLELQTNGCVGVHFTNYGNDEEYLQNLEKVSRWMVTKGVGGWWATIPTVEKSLYRKVSCMVSQFGGYVLAFVFRFLDLSCWKQRHSASMKMQRRMR